MSEEELAKHCAAEVAAADFDLAGGRLFRAVLFRMGTDQHALLLLAHHIVTDGWSFNVIQRDLGLAYEAVRAGRPPAWEPLPAQFIDLAAEQQHPGYQETVTLELDFGGGNWPRFRRRCGCRCSGYGRPGHGFTAAG